MIRGLWKFPDGGDWLWGKLGLVLMEMAKLSKSLIQFVLMGGAVFPPCCLSWGQTMVKLMKIMAKSFKRMVHSLLYLVCLTLQQVIVDPGLHRRLLDTNTQVWLSLLCTHCSFLLAPGVQVLFVSSKSLCPQSCGSSVIKSHWPPKSNSLGLLNPFARSPGWEICCVS